MNSNESLSCREAAYQAYLKALRDEGYIADTLNEWLNKERPSEADYRLAQEIAYGTCQRALTLEYYANQLVNKKLKLKRKEKALLLTALYQYFFLERIPLYAITNESIRIAKKCCHTTFTKFLNAILRKLPETTVSLPQDDSIKSLSIRYSYPEIFVKNIIEHYGTNTALNILEAGNTPSKTMARERSNTALKKFPNDDINMVVIESNKDLLKARSDKNLYIQNISPALLFTKAVKQIPTPETILDLCSSPGGKLILSHDLFPNAKLFANDVSETKLKQLNENLKKYNIDAKTTCASGQKYHSETLLDLIILDVPCSNSGVLNKRPEARWRQTKEDYQGLESIQQSLLEHATTLLAPNGTILYMTCSILKCENEEIIQTFATKHNMTIKFSETIIPTTSGYDGGFAAILTRKEA